MKNLFLCSYFTGVKDIFKDFMNNDTKGKKVLFIPTANIDEETKFLVDEAKGVFKNLGMEVEDLEISKLDEKAIKKYFKTIGEIQLEMMDQELERITKNGKYVGRKEILEANKKNGKWVIENPSFGY